MVKDQRLPSDSKYNRLELKFSNSFSERPGGRELSKPVVSGITKEEISKVRKKVWYREESNNYSAAFLIPGATAGALN